MTITADNKKRFGGNREIVIQRDGEKCVRCGMTRQAHRTRYRCDISVDHIDGSGRSQNPNNDLSNLQTLCLVCNVLKDHIHANKKYCKHGHELSGDNIRIYFIHGHRRRVCRICESCFQKHGHRMPRGNDGIKHMTGRLKLKLNLDKANEIRQKYVPGVVTRPMLAAEYGVDLSTIGDVLSGVTWKT